VRIATQIAAPPDELRWLDLEVNENVLRLQGSTCWYQRTLGRDAILATPDFGQGLAEVVPVFHLGVPQRVDLIFEFESPRRGINGLIVEAKSGAQGFDASVAQLRVYRSARPRSIGTRYLVWGLEQSDSGPITDSQLHWLRGKIADGDGDVWAFSTADSIGAVLGLLGDERGLVPCFISTTTNWLGRPTWSGAPPLPSRRHRPYVIEIANRST
jgi:hypothetical protein